MVTAAWLFLTSLYLFGWNFGLAVLREMILVEALTANELNTEAMVSVLPSFGVNDPAPHHDTSSNTDTDTTTSDIASAVAGEQGRGKKSKKSPKIKIRYAVEADRDALRDLTKWSHERTIFGDIEFSNEKFESLFDLWKQNQRFQCGLVAEREGRILGLILASCGEYVFGTGSLLTTVHVFAVEGRDTHEITRAKVFLNLLRGVQKWSKTRGCEKVIVNVTTGQDLAATDKLLRRAGGVVMGGGYVFGASK